MVIQVPLRWSVFWIESASNMLSEISDAVSAYKHEHREAPRSARICQEWPAETVELLKTMGVTRITRDKSVDYHHLYISCQDTNSHAC